MATHEKAYDVYLAVIGRQRQSFGVAECRHYGWFCSLSTTAKAAAYGWPNRSFNFTLRRFTELTTDLSMTGE